MVKSKKQMYIVIGAFILVLALFTTTFAFFNYTRIGSANVIKTGRISFNSTQGNTINLTNVFPIEATSANLADSTKVGTVTINVTGDTTYTEGIEYLVTATNVQNTVGNKSLPISIDVSVASNTNNDPATTLGTSDESYFTNRGSSSQTSIYKVLAKDTISSDDQLLVGYIKAGSDGVDGNIVIKAYLDKAKVGISDTYPEEETDTNNDGYLDGTPSSFGEDRTIFTTTEWNSLQANGVSFQIKVESNEGTWVPRPLTSATFDVGRVVNTKLKLIDHNGQYTGQDLSNSSNMFDGFERASELAQIDTSDVTHIISSPDSQIPIYAWADEHHNIKWYTEADVAYLNEDSSYMFRYCYPKDYITNELTMNFNDVNTSRVTNMSYMFAGCLGISSTSDYEMFSNFDVSNVTDMSYMFGGCLTEGEIGVSLSSLNNWDVRKVNNFTNMLDVYQMDRDSIVPGSSFNDIVYPTFTLRPGVWDNSIIDNILERHAGTYVPNN